MGKRIISLLLAVLMASTLLPTQVWAAELADSGSETEDEIVLAEEEVIPPEESEPEEQEPQEDTASTEQPASELAESDIATTSATTVASGYCGGEGDGTNLTWTLDSAGLLTINGKGEMEKYNYNSTPWYNIRTSIKQVSIEFGVSTISNDAFYNCDKLINAAIPSSVMSIGAHAFAQCSNLDMVNITDLTSWCKINFGSDDANPLYYGHNLYLNGELITNLVFPSGLISVNPYAFVGCSNLISIDISNGVTSIGDSAFYYCTSLTSVTIPDSVTSIGSYVFYGCTSLTSVTIPGSVTFIGSYAFNDCTSLSSIIIPDSVTTIGGGAFGKCTSLSSIIIPDSVTTIGGGAFANCTSLSSIIIPDSVTSIGGMVFYKCTNLSSIIIPSSVTSIGGSAFYYCTSLTSVTIPDSVTSIGSYAFCGCTSLIFITIPDGVTSIGDGALYDCTNLSSITIPDSVVSIGDRAFYDCTSLSSITIPDSVASIGDRAFNGCESLSSIIIPNSVTSIGDGAFADCTSLSSIIIPDSVTSIGDMVFYNCTNLISITIPGSVTSIGDIAFNNCTSLTDIYYTGSEAEWNAVQIGKYNGPLTSATIHYNSKDTSELPKLTFSEQEYQAVAGRNVDLRLQLVDPSGNCKELAESLVLTSSNSEVFPIDKNNILCELYGDITADIAVYGKPAVSSGTATITATLPDGTTASCQVVVAPKANSVTLKKDSYEIKVGDTGTLYLTVDNTERLSGIQLNWRSSDERVVSLETSGIINIILDGTAADSISAKCSFTAKKPGTATITCTLVNGPSVTCEVTVYSAEDAENNRTIKSNEYNAAQYNESELTKATKQIGKLKADWEKKYKKYTTAVDSVLKPLDKESDIQAALRSKENAAKQLRQADEAVGKEGKSNMMLTFQAGFPEEWKELAYQILCDIFEDHIDDTIGFDSIDFSKEISANASVINKICSKMWNESSSWRSHSYSKNKSVQVSYSCFGFLTAGFGSMTFKRGGTTYTVTICSNKSVVQKSMATYLNSCYSMGQRAVQNARKALINDMLTLTGANAIGEELFKEQVKKGLSAFESHLQEVGLGGLTDTADKIYNYYNTTKSIYNTVNGATPESLATAKKRLERDLLKLVNPDFGTSEASKVNNALTELKIASQKLYNALNELLTKGQVTKENPLDYFFGKKTQVKCPVDVEIYRGNDLIGYVGETECWYDESIYVEENDDAKIIYSSAGDELSIKLTGTDYGSLSITVEEFADGSPVERLNYYDIELQEGKEVSFNIPTETIGNVKDTMTISADGVAVAASEYISAETDASVCIDVQKNIDDAGTVSGDGVYVRGDAVVLRASAKTGYLFAGWYDEDGYLVSASGAYEFSASNDCTLLAKYIYVFHLGDVNGDSTVDVYDLQMLYEYCCESWQLSSDTFQCADVNQDSKITVLDVQMLYTYLTTGNWQ